MIDGLSLGNAILEETSRVRELLCEYKALGPVGQFGYIMLERDLKAADEAMVSGDVVAMIRAYEALKGCK